MSALLSPVGTNTAPIAVPIPDPRALAVDAVLRGITYAAVRHDSVAVAALGDALRILEGGN